MVVCSTARRKFVSLLGGMAAWPCGVCAQQTAAPIVGFLNSGSAAAHTQFVTAFRRGLGETGYVEGRNLAIEYRWAEGRYDRLPELAADLVWRGVAVIVASGGSAPALAAKKATATIPIVFATGGDPVRAGLVASLNRPGGNVTGVAILLSTLVQKRIELLRDLVPATAALGALVNPNYPEVGLQLHELQGAAQATGQQVHFARAATESDIDAAFASLTQKGARALIVANDPFFLSRRDQIVTLAARFALPTIYQGREFTAAGGLISYGPSLTNAFHQAGIYTARILKGAKPSELPVLQPAIFELAINLKTANALGITIPQSILVRADEVIE